MEQENTQKKVGSQAKAEAKMGTIGVSEEKRFAHSLFFITFKYI
jgi:hypothetical protein